MATTIRAGIQGLESPRHGRRSRWTAAIICATFVLTGGSKASAQGVPPEIFPRVDREQFSHLLEAADLERDQRIIGELLFTDYSTEMTQLQQRLDDLAEAAGSKTIDEAFAGRATVPADELRRLRIAVLRVQEQGWEDTDAAFKNLMMGMEMLTPPTRADECAAAAREFRRAVLLHPRQRDSALSEYAGDGVDVLLLFKDASAEDGELAALPANDDGVSSILSAYERELDALLLNTYASDRATRLMMRIAALERDQAALRQHEQAAVDRWRTLYDLNTRTVAAIAHRAAEMLGQAAADAWQHRYDEACFAWLFPLKKPDRQFAWMTDNALPTDVMEKAQTVYQDYVARRRAVSRQAIDLMLKGRTKFHRVFSVMMDPAGLDDNDRRALYEELLRNSGELATLESRTANALEALLSAKQRESMNAAVRAGYPDRRR